MKTGIRSLNRWEHSQRSESYEPGDTSLYKRLITTDIAAWALGFSGFVAISWLIFVLR